MSGIVSTLFPLVLPSLIPLLPLPARLRNPPSYRRLLASILSLYLALSLAASVARIVAQPSFYDVLGLHRLADPADVSAGWKAFARRNHPDRQRGSTSSSDEVFRIGRLAYDTLSDDGHRWAYDRFGPDSAGWWSRCVTQKEFLRRGLQEAVGFYVSSVVVYGAMALFGTGAKETSFWRYLILPTLLALELSLLFAPTPGTAFLSDVYQLPFPIRLLSAAFPRLTQHALVLLLRNLSMSATMFLNQVGPLVFARSQGEFADGNESEAEREKRAREEAVLVQRLGALLKVAEIEAARVFTAELSPILDPSPDLPDPGSILQSEMEAVLVDSRLRAHPAVAPLWQQAISKRRAAQEEGAPSGEETDASAL